MAPQQCPLYDTTFRGIGLPLEAALPLLLSRQCPSYDRFPERKHILSDSSQQPQFPAAPSYTAPVFVGAPGAGEPFDGATAADQLNRPLYGATFGQAVKRFFKNYANFKGRASRSEYWWSALFIFLLELIPLIIYIIGMTSTALAAASAPVDADGNIDLNSPGTEAVGGAAALLVVGLVLLIIVGLAVLIPSMAVTWRRLHDSNLPGPLWFLSLTSVGAIIVFVLTLLPSKPEGRRFDV